MIRFEKVSLDQFKKDILSFYPLMEEEYIEWCYANIQLPKRSTKGSAGYDFFAPTATAVFAGAGQNEEDYTVIPTGIRFVTDRDDIVLVLFPRSGLGFKNGMYIANTAGIIDSDYQYSSNEGHIIAKCGTRLKNIELGAGKAFIQGIILPYLTTTDEEKITTTRDGGFGSTDGGR